MTGTPLVPAPLYGLRTWTVTGGERLAGTQQAAPWPPRGAWLEAACAAGHAAPARDCTCGIHAFHPTRGAARRVLAGRREIPGVVEARGAIEVHEDGFRAERARPHALMAARGRNRAQIERLAADYDAELVDVDGADDVLAWCRARGLGLEPEVVRGLLGPDTVERRHRAARRKARRNALRLLAATVVIALLLGAGILATDDPGERPLKGRTGEVRQR